MRALISLVALGLFGCSSTVIDAAATTGTSGPGSAGASSSSSIGSSSGGAGGTAGTGGGLGDVAWSKSFGRKGDGAIATVPFPDAERTAHFQVYERSSADPTSKSFIDAVNRAGDEAAPQQPNAGELGEPLPCLDGGFVQRGAAQAGTSTVAGLPLACDAGCDFLLKTAANGEGKWVVSFGTATAYLVAPVADGSVRVAGVFDGELTLGDHAVSATSSQETFIASLDPAGQPLWLRSIAGDSGSENSNMPHTIAVDPAGDVAVSGRLHGKLQLGDGTTASSDTTGHGGDGGFVAKLDIDGKTVAMKAFAGDGNAFPYSATALFADGSIGFAGCMLGIFDFGGRPLSSGEDRVEVVAVFGADGSPGGAQLLGPCPSGPPFPALASSGHLWWAGQLTAPTTIGGVVLTPMATTDALLIELDPHAAVVKTRQFGSTGNQAFDTIFAASDGSIFTSGTFDTTIDFGQGPLAAVGTTDAFAARIFP
jgi:hypothetical protein